MIIYKIQNKINGKIYIGQTKHKLKRRINEHIKWENSYIDKSLRKNGIEFFEITVLDITNSREILNEKEQFWIKYYNCIYPNGYNLTSGGKHYEFSEESKNKIRQSRIGIKLGPQTDEHRKNISNSIKGVPKTEEHKIKISKSTIGLKKGIPKTDEHKRKLSESRKGIKRKPFSDEWKIGLSESRKGVKRGPYKKAKEN